MVKIDIKEQNISLNLT